MFDEIELKLGLAPGEALHLRRSAVLQGLRSSRRLLHSVYFDTPGFDLMRQGVALRLRKVGRRWVQTVKAEAGQAGALTVRPEWEVPVRAGRLDIDGLPEAARGFFTPAVVAALAPCFSTHFERTTWLIARAGERLELALDRGEIRAGRRRLAISEVELELQEGRPAFLFDVAERLMETVAFHMEPRSKAERGYQLAGAVVPRPVKAIAPALEMAAAPGYAWRTMVGAALTQLTANVPGLLADDDPEYIHQARVAIRRLLALAGLARLVGLRRPAWRGGLRALMGKLAPVREWDVFIGEVLPSLRGITPRQRDSVLAAAVRKQRLLRQRARTALRAAEFVALILLIGRDLVSEYEGGGSMRQWAKTALDSRLKTLRRRGRRFDRLDSAARHRLRIAAKKLRYVADAFAPLYGEAAEAYLERLAALQDELGRANDLRMALDGLPRLKLDAALATRLRGALARSLKDQAAQADGQASTLWHGLHKRRPFWRKPVTRA